MKLKSMIAMAVAGTFAASFAYAGGDKASGNKAAPSGASAPSSSAPSFSDLDKNRDGSLSRDEAASAPWAKEFSRLDTNHDGKLSKQEYAAFPELKGAATGGSSSKRSSTNSAGSK
jgi:hypothetical protein